MKRFLMMLLMSCLVLGALLSVNVFAEEQGTEEEVAYYEGYSQSDFYDDNSGPSYTNLSYYVDMTSFRATLDTNLKACKTKFDISSYKIPRSAGEHLTFYIFKDMPEAFHVERIGWTYYTSTNLMAELTIEYNMTKAKYDQTLAQCQAVAAQMLEGVDSPKLTQAEKALILHDRLAIYNEYDLSLEGPYTHEMVGAFVYRTCVCEGYAQAYSYLLDQIGIKNYYCRSALLKHGWNIVYIDGEKYHVDVTWDDPTNDITGRVKHTNFLRSTEGMLETGHYDKSTNQYDFDNSPTSTYYDNAYWQNSQTEFQLLDGKLYYIDRESYYADRETYLVEVDNGSLKALLDISDYFSTSNGTWFGLNRLSSDGENLLFSLSDTIYRYSVKNDYWEIIWQPTLPSGFAIFGFTYRDGYLICEPNNSATFATNTKALYQMKKVYSPHTHTYSNSCDTTCNTCGEVRSITHTYSNACDTSCNVCGATRSTEHYTSVLGAATAHSRQNDATYPFTASDGWFVSTNKTKSTTSTYTVTAMHNCTMTLMYKVSSEKNYDKLIIKKNSTQIVSVSGETESSTTISLAKGDVLTVSYSKDNRTDAGSDCGSFSYSCSCTEAHEIPSSLLPASCTESIVCTRCGVTVKAATGHSYTNACDPDCNKCKATRSVSHSYSNACDSTCNTCGGSRTAPHVYSNASDLTCNLCGHTRPAYTPGDLDGVGGVDMDDAIYLLFYTFYADDYPLNQPCDFDNDGDTDMDDAIYLLFHTFYAEDYPLS